MHLLEVCFLTQVIIFAIGEQINGVRETVLKSFTKSFRKTVMMEYFRNKLADLKPQKKILNKMGLCFAWNFSEQPLYAQ